MTEVNNIDKEENTQAAWQQMAVAAKETGSSSSQPVASPPAPSKASWDMTNRDFYNKFLSGTTYIATINTINPSDGTTIWSTAGDLLNKDPTGKLSSDDSTYLTLLKTYWPNGLYGPDGKKNPPQPKLTPADLIPYSATTDASGLTLWNKINDKIIYLSEGSPEREKLTQLKDLLHSEKGFLTKVGQIDGKDYSALLLHHYVDLANKIMEDPSTPVVKQTITRVDKIEYTVTQNYNTVNTELNKSLDAANSKISMMNSELSQLKKDKSEMISKGASKATIDHIEKSYNNKIAALTKNISNLDEQQKSLQKKLDKVVKDLDKAFEKFQPGKTAGAQKEANKLIHSLTKIQNSQDFKDFQTNAQSVGNQALKIDQSLSSKLSKLDPYRSVNKPGNMVYLDFTRVDSSFLNWQTNPPTVDEQKFNQWADQYIRYCNDHQIKSVDFPFSQLNELDSLCGGDLKDLDGDPSKDNIFKKFCDKLHKNNIQTQLAFGGGNAQANSFTICNGPGQTAKGQADKIASFMEKYGMTNADFDIESAGLVTKDQPIGEVKNFFSELHTRLHLLDKTTSLTVEGGLATGDKVMSIMDLLSKNNKPDWEDKFDNINLMNYAYGSDVQTASARNSEWGLEAWAIFLTTGKAIDPSKPIPSDPLGSNPSQEEIQKFAENISKLHQGFTNDIDYNNPSKSNPEGNGLSNKDIAPNGKDTPNGTAAGNVFNINQTQINEDWKTWFGKNSNVTAPSIGNSFIWPAEDKGTQDHGFYDFESDLDFYNDFYNTINKTPTDSITGRNNEFSS